MSDRFHSAFLSYKHDDVLKAGQDWAGWVENQLEGYLTPIEFVGGESIYHDPVPARIANIFRDKHEIPGMGDLNEMLFSALKRSRILIVLCSPRAASSRYVEDEIRHFKSLGRASQIIALILDGKPHSKVLGMECLPPSLAHEPGADGTPDFSREACPVYIDLRSSETGFCATSVEDYADLLRQQQKFAPEYIQAASVAYCSHLAGCRISLISGVLGLPPGKVTERERLAQIEAEEQRKKESALQLQAARKHTRLALAACLVLAGSLATSIGLAWKSRQTSAALIKAQNEIIAEKESAVRVLNQLAQQKMETQGLRVQSRSDRATMVGAADFGTSLPPDQSRSLQKAAAVKFEEAPPADDDVEQQVLMGRCFTRYGDLLYGDNGVPLSVLESGIREDRLSAYRYYQLAVKAYIKLAEATPIFQHDLAITYHRCGIAFLDQATIYTGDKAIDQIDKARGQFKLAETAEFKAKQIAIAASSGQPVSAWHDANVAIYQAGLAAALEKLSLLQVGTQAIKSMRREAKAARTNAVENFDQAIKTAINGVNQILGEETAQLSWQLQADALRILIAEDDKVLTSS